MFLRTITQIRHSSNVVVPKPSSATVNIQLPQPVNPWDAYEHTERVKPTRSGYIPVDDPAYKGWTAEMDENLIKLMTSTPEGYLQDYDKLQVEFPGKKARDIRMRWNTFLKPRGYAPGRAVQEVQNMKKMYGKGVEVYQGRWCFVPTGLPTPKPGDRTFEYTHDVARLNTVGPSSLEIAVQALQEAEDEREYKYFADFGGRKEKRRLKREGELVLEEVEWTLNEDLALREAFEQFGEDWDRVGRALKVRKRNGEECRERLELLSKEDWKYTK